MLRGKGRPGCGREGRSGSRSARGRIPRTATGSRGTGWSGWCRRTGRRSTGTPRRRRQKGTQRRETPRREIPSWLSDLRCRLFPRRFRRVSVVPREKDHPQGAQDIPVRVPGIAERPDHLRKRGSETVFHQDPRLLAGGRAREETEHDRDVIRQLPPGGKTPGGVHTVQPGEEDPALVSLPEKVKPHVGSTGRLQVERRGEDLLRAGAGGLRQEDAHSPEERGRLRVHAGEGGHPFRRKLGFPAAGVFKQAREGFEHGLVQSGERHRPFPPFPLRRKPIPVSPFAAKGSSNDSIALSRAAGGMTNRSSYAGGEAPRSASPGTSSPTVLAFLWILTAMMRVSTSVTTVSFPADRRDARYRTGTRALSRELKKSPASRFLPFSANATTGRRGGT